MQRNFIPEVCRLSRTMAKRGKSTKVMDRFKLSFTQCTCLSHRSNQGLKLSGERTWEGDSVHRLIVDKLAHLNRMIVGVEASHDTIVPFIRKPKRINRTKIQNTFSEVSMHVHVYSNELGTIEPLEFYKNVCKRDPPLMASATVIRGLQSN